MAKFYLDRISRIDSACGLRSILSLNSQALDIAERLDADRDSGIVRGPLHGLPLLLKGNIDTGDSMPTTEGSMARNVKDATPLLSVMKDPCTLRDLDEMSVVERLCDIKSTRALSEFRLGIARYGSGIA